MRVSGQPRDGVAIFSLRQRCSICCRKKEEKKKKKEEE